MKHLKILLLVFIIPLFAFTTMHKYYISVTQINYIEDKQSVQITARIFIDDFENILRARYDKSITLAGKDEPETINTFIQTSSNNKTLLNFN